MTEGIHTLFEFEWY